jgi:hypothetical protein
VGRALGIADAWIAATALGYGLPLFTHDGDFEGVTGLCLVTAQEPSLESTGDLEPPSNNATINAAAVKPFTHLVH